MFLDFLDSKMLRAFGEISITTEENQHSPWIQIPSDTKAAGQMSLAVSGCPLALAWVIHWSIGQYQLDLWPHQVASCRCTKWLMWRAWRSIHSVEPKWDRKFWQQVIAMLWMCDVRIQGPPSSRFPPLIPLLAPWYQRVVLQITLESSGRSPRCGGHRCFASDGGQRQTWPRWYVAWNEMSSEKLTRLLLDLLDAFFLTGWYYK